MHIGQLMKKLCWEHHIGAADLARKLGVSRQAVYEMYRKKHLHTRWFGPLGEVFEHDFAQYYLSEENRKKLERGDEDMEALRQENAALKEKVGMLEELNELLKGKRP